MTSKHSKEATSPVSELSAVDSRAKTSPWPVSVRASLERAAAYGLRCFASLMKLGPNGWSGRMFADLSVHGVRCLRRVEVEIWEEDGEEIHGPKRVLSHSSLSRWPTSGITEPGGYWTVNSSEWPSGGDESLVCSLREVLDAHVPQRFYLSAKAAAGILRRAEKRGRILPDALWASLVATARLDPATTSRPRHSSQSKAQFSGERDVAPSSPRTTPSSADPSSPATSETRATRRTSLNKPTPSQQVPASEGIPRSAIPSSPLTCDKCPEETSSPTTEQTAGRQGQESERQATPHTKSPNEGKQSSSPNEATPCARTQEGSDKDTIPRTSVRRLSPLEAEKLQGFLWGWTVADTDSSETQ